MMTRSSTSVNARGRVMRRTFRQRASRHGDASAKREEEEKRLSARRHSPDVQTVLLRGERRKGLAAECGLRISECGLEERGEELQIGQWSMAIANWGGENRGGLGCRGLGVGLAVGEGGEEACGEAGEDGGQRAWRRGCEWAGLATLFGKIRGVVVGGWRRGGWAAAGPADRKVSVPLAMVGVTWYGCGAAV